MALHGYARDIVPPSDFHAVTWVGDAIFVVSPRARRDDGISAIATSGAAPGRIHRHSAELASDGVTIVVRGGERRLGDGRSLQENIDAGGEWEIEPN